jgi:hypothetical protein
MSGFDQAQWGRGDLSPFLVHFTRDFLGTDAQDNLKSILSARRIEARTPYGFARTVARNIPALTASQSVACFSEAPLSEIRDFIKPITGRKSALSSYGLAFSKTTVRAKGGNPVWYYEIGGALHASLQGMFLQAFANGSNPAAHPALALFPFFEGMGRLPSGHPKEFSWEREWRHVGDFEFALSDVALVIAPQRSHEQLATSFGRKCVDPNWGLDKMLATALALV